MNTAALLDNPTSDNIEQKLFSAVSLLAKRKGASFVKFRNEKPIGLTSELEIKLVVSKLLSLPDETRAECINAFLSRRR